MALFLCADLTMYSKTRTFVSLVDKLDQFVKNQKLFLCNKRSDSFHFWNFNNNNRL